MSVSSSRFLAVDPAQSLTNSQMRNCRFGRVGKVPLVPVVVELSPEQLLLSDKPLLALAAGEVPEGQRSGDRILALEGELRVIAQANRQLSASACHPWRGGPDDISPVPPLLIAADAQVPMSTLQQVLRTAAQAGLEEAALWVSDPSPVPLDESGELYRVGELGTGGTVGAGVVALDELREQGARCVLLTPSARALGRAPDVPLEERALQQRIAVVPLLVQAPSIEQRLVTGERCGGQTETTHEEDKP